MYVTQNYICFSCNLLVFSEKRHFEIKDIKKFIKSRHAGVNPGFCITFVDPATPKVGFFSFFDRDKVLLGHWSCGVRSVLAWSGDCRS